MRVDREGSVRVQVASQCISHHRFLVCNNNPSEYLSAVGVGNVYSHDFKDGTTDQKK